VLQQINNEMLKERKKREELELAVQDLALERDRLGGQL
jgi:hypothetical protein